MSSEEGPSATRGEEDGETVVFLKEPATGAVAAIAPSIGSNVFRFEKTINDSLVKVIAAPPSLPVLRKLPTRWGAGVLFPYPGSVSGDSFKFQGEEIHLLPDLAAGHAMHGIVRRKAWRIVDLGADPVRGAWTTTSLDTTEDGISPQEWPYPFEISLTIQLLLGNLRTTVLIRNTGEKPMPFGLGFHPYFPTPLGPKGDMESCEVQIPAGYRWTNPAVQPVIAAAVAPTSWPRQLTPIKNIEVGLITPKGPIRNHWFTLWQTPASAPRLIGRLVDSSNRIQVRVTASPEFSASVFYTPPGIQSASLEPHTGLPNAFNLKDPGQPSPGLSIIAPHEEWTGWYEVEASELP